MQNAHTGHTQSFIPFIPFISSTSAVPCPCQYKNRWRNAEEPVEETVRGTIIAV